MAKFWSSFLMQVLCLSLMMNSASGLKCYSCSGSTVDSTSSQLKDKISQLPNLNINDYCSSSLDKTATDVVETSCDTNVTGLVGRCQNLVTSLEVSVSGDTATVNTYDRQCTRISETDKDKTEISNTAGKEAFDQLVRTTLDGTLKSFSQTVYLCSTDLCNSQARTSPGKLYLLIGLFLVALRSSERLVW